MSAEKPTLGYWNVRGLAQAIRLLLKYVGQDFNQDTYIAGPAPDYSKACWFDRKPTLDIPFVNLPYYIDGDIKIAQSNAILTYIGRKHNLLGETEQERVLVDIVLNQITDFRNSFFMLCYISNFEKSLPDFLEKLPSVLKTFEDFLGNKHWFVGNSITIVDFPMYEHLQHHLVLVPGCLDPCPNLRTFIKRFEALPAIKKYMSSDEFMRVPINNPQASACTSV